MHTVVSFALNNLALTAFQHAPICNTCAPHAAPLCLCFLPHRFDVRALLDFYKEPDPRVLAARQKSHEELKLEEVRVGGF